MKFASSVLPVACFLLAVGFIHANKGNNKGNDKGNKKGHNKRMSIDKQILDAAADAQMFDVFHVMPEGDLKIMMEYDILLSLDQYKKLRGKSSSKRAAASNDRSKRNGIDRIGNGNQRSRLGRGNRNWPRRQKRKADRDTSLLWPNCIVYYEVDEGFTDEDRVELDLAIEEWQEFTCLQFTKSKTAQSRLQFKNGAGCYSMLGRQTQPQIVALAPTCRSKGIIAHEIGHAIGWYHEHMRPDRDQYVSINFDNIPMRYHVNFDKYEENVIDDYGVEYDYTSLMHYGNDALPGSIIARDPSYQDKMGQREGLTFKDIKLANVMYDCANVMGCTARTCEFGGFQLYKAYKNAGRCECWCESGDVTDPLVLCSELDSAPPQPSIRPTETPVVDLCYDVRDDCEALKSQGQCMSKLALMMDICKQTCELCGTGTGDGGREVCMDHDKGCPMMAAAGLCETLEPVMKRQCPASCNICGPTPPDPCQIQKSVMASLDPSHGGSSRSATVSLFLGLITLSVATIGLA
ncbi:hypothetical protein EGW08_008017 [Elysia chlorotica]|uniref:Metalloendopeptidase n=1 Tax=Elysia chlorotica TaxID=188477 RepID=A0A3S0ZRL3_ELYCH|nr:hypothetical protein EGW08_008017 [Elysia chlorotica]